MRLRNCKIKQLDKTFKDRIGIRVSRVSFDYMYINISPKMRKRQIVKARKINEMKQFQKMINNL